MVTVLVCVILGIRLPRANPTVALIPAVDPRRHHRHRHPTGEGRNRARGERAPRGRRRGCLAAILGPPLGVVTVEVVVVVVPAPAR